MQLACEDQFEFNASFRKELKDLEMMETPCVGVDSDGQRHWLLKVNNDIYSLSLPLMHTMLHLNVHNVIILLNSVNTPVLYFF